MCCPITCHLTNANGQRCIPSIRDKEEAFAMKARGDVLDYYFDDGVKLSGSR